MPALYIFSFMLFVSAGEKASKCLDAASRPFPSAFLSFMAPSGGHMMRDLFIRLRPFVWNFRFHFRSARVAKTPSPQLPGVP